MATITVSTGTANAIVDAVVDRLDGGAPGTIEVRTGVKPASPDDAATGTLLATFTLSNPAFGSASGRSASINAVASVTAVATGTAGYFRAKNSAGTAQFDGDVGTAGEELNLNTTSITSGGTVSVTGGTVSVA
jgi:hypothetical protein